MITEIPKSWEEKYEDLKREFEQYKLESIKWSVEDFTTLEVDGEEISEEEAQSALENMIYMHDCNNGITWDDVYDYFHRHSVKVSEGEEQWRKDLIKEQHLNGE